MERGIIACRYGFPPTSDRPEPLSPPFRLSHNRAMDINRFTEKLQEAIRSAQEKATRYGHQQIDVEHLLAALLEQEGGLAPPSWRRPGSTLSRCDSALESELERLPKVSGPSGAPDQIYVTAPLESAAHERRRRGQEAQRRIHFGGARAAGAHRTTAAPQAKSLQGIRRSRANG